MTRDPLAELRRLYPSERLLEQPAQLIAYESDGLTAFRARPRAVVLPENRREVIETVRFCQRERLPFVARGSCTSLSGGSMPVEDGLVEVGRDVPLLREEAVALRGAG